MFFFNFKNKILILFLSKNTKFKKKYINMVIFNFILLYLFSKRMLVLIVSLISFVAIIILLSFPVEEDSEKESNNTVEAKNKSENQNKSANKQIPINSKSSLLSLIPVYVRSISKYIKMKKTKIRIFGYHILLQNENVETNQKYILSNLFQDNISDLSKKMYIYYKEKILSKNNKQIITNKNKELSSMFIECLASINCDWHANSQNIFQKLLFNSTDWMLSDDLKNGEKDKSIVPSYIRYKYEDSLDNKILMDELTEDDYENFIIRKHYEIGIVKSFKCDINKYIITKIIKNINHNYYKIFSQGNPFAIRSICKAETIPKNFENIVKMCTSSNKVVLALAGKMVKMNYLHAQKIKRNECENNMIFLGFIILDGIKYAYR
jgi:hypothetical protein